MVAQQIRSALEAAVGGDIEFTVERPKQAGHGDYASNAALVVAKRDGKDPKEVAEALRGKLASERFEVSVGGPGFLNFTASPGAWQEVLQRILDERLNYGSAKPTNRKVQVEFISANPTGPLTLGNGRGGFGGDILANVLARAGNAVEREYYINDIGGQIDALGASLKGTDKVYSGPYVDELATKLDGKKSEAELGREAAELLTEEIRATVTRMGISFDSWFSERAELHETGAIEKVLADMETADATYEQDGALWLKTTQFGDDKDRVLKKSDGTLTYLAADLAHYYRALAIDKVDVRINILGADHHGYVARMQAGVEFLRAADEFTGQSVILVTQLVRLVQGGKEVKMSKRAGTFVALDDLLDEVEPDVARFFFVMRSFDTHMDFDMDLAKERSEKNPVFYLKYAHARICSILDKTDLADEPADLAKLTEPAELALIKELAEFPEIVTRTAEDYQVQRVPHYALAVADAFHKFYEQCRVISDDAELTKARLQVVRGTQIVLRNLGDTLGIEMPETM